MPLMPFKLFNDETRLIVHNECLYKLKLTYKSELSLTKAPSSQKNEVNRELTKVIRAVLFLIKTEKHIPRKIHTRCFTVYVTVKFWKIALKLGFSKNGSRLKCGHLIQLTIYMEENRIQEKESSKINAQVNSNNKSCLEKKAKNENLELFNHMGLRQFVINSDDSDSESGASSESVIICSSPKHSIPARNVNKNAVSTGIDSTTENFRIPKSQLNQTKSSDQTPMISDQTGQALSNSAQLLNELPHSSHSPKEASDPVIPVFISSCTQTDPDELDFCANNSDVNSRTLVKTSVCHIQSDHDYLKSLAINHAENTMSKHAASNSNKVSTNLQDKQFSDIDQRPSVTNMNSSLCENNEGNGSSVSDDDDDDDNNPGQSHLEEVSSPAEFDKAAEKVNIETLNAEPGNTFVDSLSKQSDIDHQDKNDVWGIESRQFDVVSEVEIPMESHSESSQDDITEHDNSKHFCWSKNTSKQCSKKVSRADRSEEQVVQNKNSSNTERTNSSSQKLKSGLSKKPVKPTVKTLEMVPKNRSRMRSLRSYKKVDNITDQKLRKSKSHKKLPKRQVFSSLEKKTPNKKMCKKRQLPSNSDKCEKKTKQENRIPEDQTEISYGLHDRYQVQTQELQEDLKLQNLAHPSSSSTDKKKHSFLEYINFGYFLRRGKETK